MRAVLGEVRARIERYRGTRIGEQNTKLTLINPVIRALGWDVEDLEDVRHEYRRLRHENPVDYALLLARTPEFFVEAKGLDENLNDPKWAGQVIAYASVAGVAWVVLTNGDEYRLYNAHAPVPAEDKLFRTVRISDGVDAAAEALVLLSKVEAREKSLGALWAAYSIDRRVRVAIEQIFTEPSPWFVRRLARDLEGLSSNDVRDALSRATLTLDFPVEEPPPRRPTAVPGVVDERQPESASSKAARAPGRKSRARRRIAADVAAVSVAEIIDAGLIRPPLDLERAYKGRQLTARIETNGEVSCLGKSYESVSLAAAMARHSVIGAPPGRKYPPTNGWTFWRFRDENGELCELSVLRERVASARQ